MKSGGLAGILRHSPATRAADTRAEPRRARSIRSWRRKTAGDSQKAWLVERSALLFAVLALLAAGCGDDDDEGSSGGTTTEASGGGGAGVEALPSSSCTAVEYEGEGDPDVLIASDCCRDRRGRGRSRSWRTIRYLAEQSNFKAGDHNVAFQSCDDATAQAGKWDSGKCSTNAQAYAGNSEDVVGVIGTFNSGCAAIEIPVLNQAPGGGVAVMSPANTYVCLTESGPAVTAPSRTSTTRPGTRNYARVVATRTRARLWRGSCRSRASRASTS